MQNAAAGVSTVKRSRFVWPTRSTSLLARAPIVVCSARGSQQKYCVALSLKKVGATTVCV